QHVPDVMAVLGRDPEAACAPEDVAVLLAGVADRGRVDDRQELLDVVEQHPIEEVLVAVLERREADVLLERLALARDIVADAPLLLLHAARCVGQQAFEAERLALLARERASLGVERMVQKLRSATGHFQPRASTGIALPPEGLHDASCSRK